MSVRREYRAPKHSHILWRAVRHTSANVEALCSPSVTQGSTVSLGLKCKNDSPRTDLGGSYKGLVPRTGDLRTILL